MKNKKLLFISIPAFLIISFWLLIFYNQMSKEPIDYSKVGDIVNFEIIEDKDFEMSKTLHLKMHNISGYKIAYFKVYLSYPISNKDRTGHKANEYKVEGLSNKITLGRSESAVIRFNYTVESIEGNELLLTNQPYLEIVGYFDSINENTQFTKMSGLDILIK